MKLLNTQAKIKASMEDETAICKGNEKHLMEAMTHIQSAIDELKQIDS